MCIGSRKDGDGGLARSRDIDKQICQDKKRMSKEIKLLLLGTLGPVHRTIHHCPLPPFFMTMSLMSRTRAHDPPMGLYV
jgi:hypothetical protein